MTPEDHLDQLIEHHLHDASSPLQARDEEAALLAAAAALARLNELEAPPDLAARLKGRFRAQMRARHQGRLTSLERQPGGVPGRRRARFPRPWVMALGVAAVLLLACLGVVHAAASSLPGDPLYGVKQVEQQVALTSAGSPADRTRLQLSQLQGAIADLEAEVNASHADGAIGQALSIVATQTHNSQSAVASLPAGAEREAVEQTLRETLHSERTTLSALLARVDWPLRLAFTQQLGALGAAVPTITQVTVSAQGDETFLITITGTNFAPNATLVIDGRPTGKVCQRTPTQLVVVISASDWPGSDAQALGVLNPDGTAAQVVLSGNTEQNQGTPQPTDTPETEQTPAGEGGQQGTPTPTSTPDEP